MIAPLLALQLPSQIPVHPSKKENLPVIIFRGIRLCARVPTPRPVLKPIQCSNKIPAIRDRIVRSYYIL